MYTLPEKQPMLQYLERSSEEFNWANWEFKVVNNNECAYHDKNNSLVLYMHFLATT